MTASHLSQGGPALTRRAALGLAIGGAVLTIPSFAHAGQTDKRLVVIILRGALDGLHAAPAFGDPAYQSARTALALRPPGGDGAAFALTDLFGLHPALKTVHQMYREGEALVVHAAATAYRERSHFDAQNVLETGAAAAFARNTGWLNAALASIGGGRPEAAIAIAQQAPLIVRGPAAVTTWSPSPLPDAEPDTLARLMDLYGQTDPGLLRALSGAVAANAIAMEGGMDMGGGGGRAGRHVAPAARAAAGFLRQPNGPIAAVIEVGGWDSHANQGQETGQIATLLGHLDAGLAALKADLGPTWAHTAVLVATEFGRTVGANGNRGTDHGTGAAAFLVGGAIKGGRVIADWPGLAPHQLYERRDLRPTLDLRAVCKGVLADHLGVSTAALARDVFPDSGAIAAMADLLRG
jgi:uncharacterized protein (DUF1501 family)